jgi:hypothetical protein
MRPSPSEEIKLPLGVAARQAAAARLHSAKSEPRAAFPTIYIPPSAIGTDVYGDHRSKKSENTSNKSDVKGMIFGGVDQRFMQVTRNRMVSVLLSSPTLSHLISNSGFISTLSHLISNSGFIFRRRLHLFPSRGSEALMPVHRRR